MSDSEIWHMPLPWCRHQHCFRLWFLPDFFWISSGVWLRDLASAFTLIQASTLLPRMISSWKFFLDFMYSDSETWHLPSRWRLHLDSGINSAALLLISSWMSRISLWFFLDLMYSDSETWHLPYPWFRHQQCSAASASLLTFSPNSVLVRQLANLVSSPDFSFIFWSLGKF